MQRAADGRQATNGPRASGGSLAADGKRRWSGGRLHQRAGTRCRPAVPRAGKPRPVGGDTRPHFSRGSREGKRRGCCWWSSASVAGGPLGRRWPAALAIAAVCTADPQQRRVWRGTQRTSRPQYSEALGGVHTSRRARRLDAVIDESLRPRDAPRGERRRPAGTCTRYLLPCPQRSLRAAHLAACRAACQEA